VAHAAAAVRALISPTVVLGGTGFIGSHLVERLAGRGDVTVVARRGTWPWGDLPRRVQVVSLDLARNAVQYALDEILSHATTVVNLTGMLARPRVPAHEYVRLHVDATHRITDALAHAKTEISRLIHVSTTGVLGPTGDEPRDEESPPRPATPYERTKLEGETLALASRRPHREVVIVRPGLVYGPRDLHLVSWFRAIAQGTYRPIAAGRAVWQPIFVDDVVRGIEAAIKVKGADGQTFHLAGAERVTVAALADRIGKALGTRTQRASLPLPLAMAAGTLLEAAFRPFGADPPLSRARVKTMTESRVYSIARAESLLGFRPSVPLDTGLRATVAWYRDRRLLS